MGRKAKAPQQVELPQPEDAAAQAAAPSSGSTTAPSSGSAIASDGSPPDAPSPATPTTAPSSPPGDFWWKCWRCGKPAKIFDVDGAKGEEYLCERCCAFEFDIEYTKRNDAKKGTFHSLEAINPKQTTPIISTITDAVILPILLTFLFLITRTGIPEGYNDGIDVCPLVDQARGLVFSIDAGVSLLTKEYFYVACNIEDAFVRLWIDVFVRCIATNTDSLMLLAVTYWRAQLYHSIVVRMIFVPVAMAFFGAFSTFVHFSTQALPDFESNERLKSFKKHLTGCIDLISPRGKRLPNTLYRSRPKMQYMDYIKYRYGRIPRLYKWFKQSAGDRLEALTKVNLPKPIPVLGTKQVDLFIAVPILIRVSCMLPYVGTRIGSLVYYLAKIFVPNTFWLSPHIDFTKVYKDTYSGVLFEAILRFAVRRATGVGSWALGFLGSWTPPIVVQTVGFVLPHLVMLLNALIANFLVVLVVVTLLGVYFGIKKLLNDLYKSQLSEFGKAVKDDKTYPFATYEARMKFMPKA